MLTVVVGVVLITGAALKKFMPELVSQATAPIQRLFGRGGGGSDSGSGKNGGRSWSSLLPGGGDGSSSGGGSAKTPPKKTPSSRRPKLFPDRPAGGSGSGENALLTGGSDGYVSGGSDAAATASPRGRAGSSGPRAGASPRTAGGSGGVSAGRAGASAEKEEERKLTGGSSAAGPAQGVSAGDIGSGFGDLGQRRGLTGAASRLQAMASAAKGGADIPKGDWNKVYARMEPGDFGPPSEIARSESLTKRLRSNHEVKNAYRNWHKLTQEQRMGALQSMSNDISSAYGLESRKLVTHDFPATQGRILAFERKDGTTYVNTASLDDRDLSFETTLHQEFHRYQTGLIGDYRSGALGPSDDRYELAGVLSVNKAHYMRSRDYEAYRNQPFERQAYLMDGVAAVAMSAITLTGAGIGDTFREIKRLVLRRDAGGVAGHLLPGFFLLSIILLIGMLGVVFRSEMWARPPPRAPLKKL